MKSKIAINLMLLIVGTVTIFHFCILLGFIPFEITWGGRLKNVSEMYVFETISILINFILGITLLIKGSYIKPFISEKMVNIILWVFLIIFALNTIGNLFAKTNFEKLFSILTFFMSILIWKVLKGKK